MRSKGRRPPARLLGDPKVDPAMRVVDAFRACTPQPPRLIGTTTLDGLSMFVRKLTPQEDKLDLTRLRKVDLEPLAAYLGALTGAGARTRRHEGASGAVVARRAGGADVSGESPSQAIHEAVYLALCKLARDIRTGDRAT